MTARFGGAYGRGYTSKGESVVEQPSEARQRAQKERVRTMARKNSEDAFSATPGARAAGVKEVEQPLAVGPRDALIEDGHNEDDYVPDSESKGYHAGLLRQPVKAMADARGQVVGFTSDNPSKFAEQPTIADLKAAANKRESTDEWNEDVDVSAPITADRQSADMYDAAPARGGSRRGGSRSANTGTVGEEIASAGEGE